MKTLVVATLFYFLLSFDALSSEQTLINGEVVDQKDYPYVVKIRSGNASCTATVVGKRVVLTAAHCVRSGGTVTFKTTAGGSFSGKAVRSPIYPRKDHDIAVVILSEDVDVPAAHISKQSLKVGDSLFLMGFGCTRPRGGGTDGKLRAGSAEVKRFNGYDAVSSSGAALCFGDSGGPGFVADPRGGHPVITTVNSKGDIRTTNYTAMLATSASKEFLELMAKNHDTEICGLTSDCEKEPDPEPEPEPEPEPDPGPEPEPGCDSEKQAFIIKEVRQCLKL